MFFRGVAHVLNKHATFASNFRSNLVCPIYSRKCSNKSVTKMDMKAQALISRVEKREQIYKKSLLSEEELEKRHCQAKNPFQFFDPQPPTSKSSFVLENIGSWMDMIKQQREIFNQRFISDRHEILGCDLAAAHFVLYRGGRIKMNGSTDWVERNVPYTYDKDFFLTAIDLRGFQICYDGLDNLCSLDHLEWLSLKGSSLLDDWGLDKISAEYPNLKYLDISDCKNVSERGLESLYRMYNLETLLVTNHNKSAAFELTCFMLEDCNPKLSCNICLPEEGLEQ